MALTKELEVTENFGDLGVVSLAPGNFKRGQFGPTSGYGSELRRRFLAASCWLAPDTATMASTMEMRGGFSSRGDGRGIGRGLDQKPHLAMPALRTTGTSDSHVPL